jgi:hypothetical protein
MAALERYRQIIATILTEYAQIPYAYGDIQTETVFNRTHDRYLLVNVGWDNGQRVHGTPVHVDMIDGKLWIQRDGTEHGIAKELVRAEVPKDHIVLGFRPVKVRRHTEYAVA